jgi:cellulose synthase/poly-beta-1,6-N-acetylglucosamine synthase-like glycosyltransferase
MQMMAMTTFLIIVYSVILIGLALYGFNALIFSGLFLARYQRRLFEANTASAPTEWPTVTVQLPIFNERLVVERLIDAVAGLDYPRDKLSIQVLDDSTDETVLLARARVAYHRERGVDIACVRRPDRQGFKAGALAYGLKTAPGEFVAIFDADFVPPPDFLRRVIPHFDDPQVGMVQTRWGHLNAEASPFTRAQALALDGHFVVEQTVRSRSGLLLNFNGSAGVWRRICIEDVGGWQADTIAEDLDLSYRAQLAGWTLRYLPEVVAPAEIPPLLTAFKRQQFRWAKGAIQCLRKFSGRLLTAQLSIWRKMQALLHLSSYLVHPLMLAMILIGLPVILIRDPGTLPLGALGVAGFAPPVLFALSQWGAYSSWPRRFMYFPFLVLLGAGVTLNNSWAVFEALVGRNAKEFLRTPKFRVEGRQADGLTGAGDYTLPVDWSTWGELALACYCLLETVIAFNHAPGLTPFLAMYTLGYIFTAGLGLWQSRNNFFSARRMQSTRRIQHHSHSRT